MLSGLEQLCFAGSKWLRRCLVSAPSAQRVVLVSGVHRSGTNMMMDILGRSWETAVFNEHDRRAFDNYILREDRVVRTLVRSAPARVVVLKALHEAHAIDHLLDEFAPSKAIWMFRHFDDVINSSLEHWPGWRNKIDELIQDRSSADWRGLGMTDETYRIVRAHYHPKLTDAEAIALFWYYRNQLAFDQNLHADPRVALVHYEDLASCAGDYVIEVARFLGITFSKSMQRVAHNHSIRRYPPQLLDNSVRALCEQMHETLIAAYMNQRWHYGNSASPTPSNLTAHHDVPVPSLSMP